MRWRRRICGHDLERLLVRLLFCLFADDTGIFEPKDIFLQLIETTRSQDGSDTGPTSDRAVRRARHARGQAAGTLGGGAGAFPLCQRRAVRRAAAHAGFDNAMREMLLDCRTLRLGQGFSPAIFGSLFQSVMDAKERRAKGAHYTSETNILKVIGPLFLDELRAELDAAEGAQDRPERGAARISATSWRG